MKIFIPIRVTNDVSNKLELGLQLKSLDMSNYTAELQFLLTPHAENSKYMLTGTDFALMWSQ